MYIAISDDSGIVWWGPGWYTPAQEGSHEEQRNVLRFLCSEDERLGLLDEHDVQSIEDLARQWGLGSPTFLDEPPGRKAEGVSTNAPA